MIGKMLHEIRVWLPIAFVTTVMAGTIYVAVQQNYRQSANDPQMQMAEDTANAMNQGSYHPGSEDLTQIDISKSLAPFTIVFDASDDVLSSNAVLNGQVPQLPSGVFTGGRDRLTWEPQNGVRIATVIKRFDTGMKDGYVVVGRNLREVEARIVSLGFFVLCGWGITMVGSFVLILFLEIIFPKKK